MALIKQDIVSTLAQHCRLKEDSRITEVMLTYLTNISSETDDFTAIVLPSIKKKKFRLISLLTSKKGRTLQQEKKNEVEVWN